MKNIRPILATHYTPDLKKFVKDSNLSTTGLKRAEIIDLMQRNYERFLHIKPNKDRYKHKKKQQAPKPKLKKPTLVAPKKLQAKKKLKAHFDPFLTKKLGTPLMTPKTPMLKTPKTPMLKTPKTPNPLKDVQFKSMY